MRKRLMSLGGAALVLAVVAGAALLVSGPGYRIGVLPLRTAFTVLQWGAYLGLAAVAMAGAALWRAKGRNALGASALIVGLLCVIVPLRLQRMAAAAPPIHDITTDTTNPPSFDAIVPLRAEAPNSLDYSQETARQQREAYPEIAPLILQLPAPQAFDRALAAAQNAGWEIVATNADTGRIEATDTTTFFGFKDDIVVRLTPLEDRTVVDVRSVSRVGRGDVGTNARRIRDYLDALSR